jgi:hypothetical protein
MMSGGLLWDGCPKPSSVKAETYTSCCQHLGGTAVVKGLLDTLIDGLELNLSGNHKPLLFMVDMHGYDAAPSLAVLERIANNDKEKVDMACATLCHDEESRSYVAAMTCAAIHTAAKGKKLKMPNFPDIDKVVKELNAPHTDPRGAVKLRACVYLPGRGNALAIQERLVQKWLGSRDGKKVAEFEALLEKRNKEFNPHGAKESVKRALDDGDTDQPAAKREKVDLVQDEVNTWEKLMSLNDLCPAPRPARVYRIYY